MTYNIGTNKRYGFNVVVITDRIHDILSPIVQLRTSISENEKKQIEWDMQLLDLKLGTYEGITKCQMSCGI